jgi:hypothetical protein
MEIRHRPSLYLSMLLAFGGNHLMKYLYGFILTLCERWWALAVLSSLTVSPIKRKQVAKKCGLEIMMSCVTPIKNGCRTDQT